MRRLSGRTGIGLALCLLAVLAWAVVPAARQGAQATPAQAKPGDLGFTDTPKLPGMPWHVHDPSRPRPRVVTPGATVGAPPSDAIVLFDGKDLSKWSQRGPKGEVIDPKWPVRDGFFETGARTGSLYTRESFGDVQLHIEWASPTPVVGNSQGRGNSGVILMGLYEVQVLDSYENPTYADGQAAALYGQWPPLVNAARKPGEWQTYDIIFEAPRFEGGKLVSPAYQTVLWNGVIVHNRKEVMGPMVYRDVASYKQPHAAELPLMLQDHNNPVRYRNIWIRRLGGYDTPQKP
jgi:hypothetical protein